MSHWCPWRVVSCQDEMEIDVMAKKKLVRAAKKKPEITETRKLLGQKRPCFLCDGTGQMCDVCGESMRVCGCDESESSSSACSACGGKGIASADQ